MTIVRRWRGLVSVKDRDAYVRYVADTGAADYAKTTGNIAAEIHTRNLDDGTCEIVTLSWWSTLAAIEAFAGKDATRARYYAQDDRYLLQRPTHVEHLELVHRKGRRA